METKDAVQIVVSLVTPLIAVLLAQQVIAKREKNDRTMQLFYDLVGHLNAFKMTLFSNTSHARRREEFLRRYDSYAENIKGLEKRRVQSLSGTIKRIGEPNTTEEIDETIKELQQAIGEENKESNEESVRVGAERRLASSALIADCLMLEMLYHAKARPLIESLSALKSKADIFESQTPDYFEKCFPLEKELPAMIERIQKEVTDFWKVQYRDTE